MNRYAIETSPSIFLFFCTGGDTRRRRSTSVRSIWTNAASQLSPISAPFQTMLLGEMAFQWISEHRKEPNLLSPPVRPVPREPTQANGAGRSPPWQGPTWEIRDPARMATQTRSTYRPTAAYSHRCRPRRRPVLPFSILVFLRQASAPRAPIRRT